MFGGVWLPPCLTQTVETSVVGHFILNFSLISGNLCSLCSLQTMALLLCPALLCQKATTRKQFL